MLARPRIVERVTSPRHGARTRSSGALATCLGLVAGGLVLGTPASAGAVPDAPGAAARSVPTRRAREGAGQPLREATRRLENGRADLRASFAQVAVTWRSGDLTAVARAHGSRGWTAWPTSTRSRGGRRPAHRPQLWGPVTVGFRCGRWNRRSHGVDLVPRLPRSGQRAPVRRTAAHGDRRAAHRSTHRAPKPTPADPHVGAPRRSGAAASRATTDTIKQVHIHHTASGNDYKRAERAAPDPRDLPLPHAHAGVVRHRLQLPGRPLRAGLGRPRRRMPPSRCAGHTPSASTTPRSGIAVIGNYEPTSTPRDRRW